MNRAFHLVGWGFVAVCATLAARAGRTSDLTLNEPTTTTVQPTYSPPVGGSDAVVWFRQVKPYCNSVEIKVLQRQNPAPATPQGQGYRAACFALAGKIDEARAVIDALPEGERPRAAEIVFEIGHPVADAGDDRSAGPIMELVIDYWPNHYMALYHAGMAEYMLGQYPLAKRNLIEFLKYYHEDDGWTGNAKDVLKRLENPETAKDLRRPREPGQ